MIYRFKHQEMLINKLTSTSYRYKLSGKEEIIASAMEQFEGVHQKYLPKVDRRLIIDLFSHLRENPDIKPMYTVEAFV